MFARQHGAEKARSARWGLLALIVAAIVAVALSGVGAYAAWAEEASEGPETIASEAEVQPTTTSEQSADNADTQDEGVSTASVTVGGQTGNWVYVYVKLEGDTSHLKDIKLNSDDWYTIGKVFVPNLRDPIASDYDEKNGIHYSTLTKNKDLYNQVVALVPDQVDRYTKNNTSIDISDASWDYSTSFGLICSAGAADYTDEAPSNKPNGEVNYTWHLDGHINAASYGALIVKFIDIDTNEEISNSVNEIAKVGDTYFADTYKRDIEGYQYVDSDPASVVISKDTTSTINIYYRKNPGSLSITKNVAGGAANVDEHFTFQVSCEQLKGKTVEVKYNDKVTSGDGATHPAEIKFNSEGVSSTSLQLKHGETATLLNLPADAKVTVTETAKNGAYTSVQITGDVMIDTNDSASCTATIVSGDTTSVAFLNTAEIAPDAGISASNVTPMAGLLAAATCGGIALAATKARKKTSDDGKE